jgi:hypothetical protein
MFQFQLFFVTSSGKYVTSVRALYIAGCRCHLFSVCLVADAYVAVTVQTDVIKQIVLIVKFSIHTGIFIVPQFTEDIVL